MSTVLFQVPKIAVPLNTTKYNPSLDDNLTLISSFNKFPYPTQAELSWLTAVSKHPEEQIKVWFTTQRLKQGISWSPEEVGILVMIMFTLHFQLFSFEFCFSGCFPSLRGSNRKCVSISFSPLLQAVICLAKYARSSSMLVGQQTSFIQALTRCKMQ